MTGLLYLYTNSIILYYISKGRICHDNRSHRTDYCNAARCDGSQPQQPRCTGHPHIAQYIRLSLTFDSYLIFHTSLVIFSLEKPSAQLPTGCADGFFCAQSRTPKSPRSEERGLIRNISRIRMVFGLGKCYSAIRSHIACVKAAGSSTGMPAISIA